MTYLFPLFWKACFLGFIVAIPVGPVGLLLIQRSLKVNHIAGVATGLGAALADAVFGTSDLDKSVLGHVFNGYDTSRVKKNLKKVRNTADDPRVGAPIGARA